MSATVASRRVYKAFLGKDLGPETFYHGHSYGGNALAAAVALKHLELIQSSDLLANVRERSSQLNAALIHAVGRFSIVKDIRIAGLMGAVKLDTSRDALLPRRVCRAMVQRGVLSRSMGSVVTLVPPLTVTVDEIDRIVSTLQAALKDVLK
jgi:adenosylmethionine-8-amino-7-oxononanoate aminotransferase